MTYVANELHACVAQRLQTRLSSALPGATFSGSLRELGDAIEKSESAVAFVDPATDERFAERVITMSVERPTVVFVIYTVLDASYFQDVVRLVAAGIRDVVLFGFDDHQRRLEALLVDIVARQQLPAIMSAVEPHLIRLPPALRRAIRELFGAPCTIPIVA